MTTKTRILIGILVIGIVLIGGWWVLTNSPLPKVGQPPKPEVAINTDKTKYRQGETVKITVRNGLDVPVLYYGDGDRFWGIEYLEDGKWKNPDYERGGGFQLTEENIGDPCYIILYETVPPTELKSEDSLSRQWNQKICPFGTTPFGTTSPAEPRIVRYIESGQYRLIFIYGFEMSDVNRFSDSKTVYSNSFIIK